MNKNDIAELLRPFAEINDTQLEQTLLYLNLVLKWNARINLTAVRQPEHIVERHFGESFFTAAQLLNPTQGTTVIDLGSGAGFPGLPMAIFAPGASVTLIEAKNKKTAFLNEVIRLLDLKNANVFWGRGEDYTKRGNVVTMRAVESFEASLSVAAGLVEKEGRIALMIGQSQIKIAKNLGQEYLWREAIVIPGGHSRVLMTADKTC